MSFFDIILGRTRPSKPDLDALFALPGAAVTLEAVTGLRPTGAGAVVFEPASSQTFAAMYGEVMQLVRAGARDTTSEVREADDSFGYHWVILRSPRLEDLVTSAHMVNTTFADHGFGPQLLCSLFGFAQGAQKLYLVYLYKRGTFYPFAPLDGQRRDNALELRVRGALRGELRIEEDLSRWFPLWGLPIG
jgi:hypothetical protein